MGLSTLVRRHLHIETPLCYFSRPKTIFRLGTRYLHEKHSEKTFYSTVTIFRENDGINRIKGNQYLQYWVTHVLYYRPINLYDHLGGLVISLFMDGACCLTHPLDGIVKCKSPSIIRVENQYKATSTSSHTLLKKNADFFVWTFSFHNGIYDGHVLVLVCECLQFKHNEP